MHHNPLFVNLVQFNVLCRERSCCQSIKMQTSIFLSLFISLGYYFCVLLSNLLDLILSFICIKRLTHRLNKVKPHELITGKKELSSSNQIFTMRVCEWV